MQKILVCSMELTKEQDGAFNDEADISVRGESLHGRSLALLTRIVEAYASDLKCKPRGASLIADAPDSVSKPSRRPGRTSSAALNTAVASQTPVAR
jgi:hypothetical protein